MIFLHTVRSNDVKLISIDIQRPLSSKHPSNSFIIFKNLGTYPFVDEKLPAFPSQQSTYVSLETNPAE